MNVRRPPRRWPPGWTSCLVIASLVALAATRGPLALVALLVTSPLLLRLHRRCNQPQQPPGQCLPTPTPAKAARNARARAWKPARACQPYPTRRAGTWSALLALTFFLSLCGSAVAGRKRGTGNGPGPPPDPGEGAPSVDPSPARAARRRGSGAGPQAPSPPLEAAPADFVAGSHVVGVPAAVPPAPGPPLAGETPQAALQRLPVVIDALSTMSLHEPAVAAATPLPPSNGGGAGACDASVEVDVAVGGVGAAWHDGTWGEPCVSEGEGELESDDPDAREPDNYFSDYDHCASP
jgi:hypothetical protein